jgi:hypothetical protein
MSRVGVNRSLRYAAIGVAGIGVPVGAAEVAYRLDDPAPISQSQKQADFIYQSTATIIGQGVLSKLASGDRHIQNYAEPDIAESGGYEITLMLSTSREATRNAAGCLVRVSMKKDTEGDPDPDTTYAASIGCSPGPKHNRGPIQFNHSSFLLENAFGTGWIATGKVISPQTGQTIKLGSSTSGYNSDFDPAVAAMDTTSAGVELAQSALELPLFNDGN